MEPQPHNHISWRKTLTVASSPSEIHRTRRNLLGYVDPPKPCPLLGWPILSPPQVNRERSKSTLASQLPLRMQKLSGLNWLVFWKFTYSFIYMLYVQCQRSSFLFLLSCGSKIQFRYSLLQKLSWCWTKFNCHLITMLVRISIHGWVPLNPECWLQSMGFQK